MLIYDSIVCKQQDGKTLLKRTMFVKKDYTRMEFCNEGAQHRNSRGSCEPAENLCRYTSFLSTTPPRKSRGWGGFDRFLKASKKKIVFFLKKKASQALSPPVMLGGSGCCDAKVSASASIWSLYLFFSFSFCCLSCLRRNGTRGRACEPQTGLRLRQRQVGVVTLKT